jgi:multidrug efflux pump subunit AcrA (membrane-fusion protein)
MNRHAVALIFALGAATSGDQRPEDSPGTIQTTTGYLRLIDQVDVPARVAGVLSSVAVREGMIVRADDLLARIDDDDAKLVVERAQLDLDVARKQAENQAEVEAAKTAVAEAEAARDKVKLEEEIARQKAAADFAVRYARRSATVAHAELQRAQAARKEVRDSVSQNEIEHLQLTFDKAKSELEQAEHDLRAAGLQSRVKLAEVSGLEATIRRRELELKQTSHELAIADIARRLREHDLTVARRDLDRRQIKAPLGGVVVQTYRKPGEWVEPGEKVVRILRLDRLRVEAFVMARDLQRDPMGVAARLTISLPGNKPVDYPATVTFVSPEIDPVNGQVLVWAEVDNPAPAYVLRPGMRAALSIELPPARNLP